MTTRAKFSRRTLLTIAAAFLLLFLAISAFLFREPHVPHVTATFLSFHDSLRPRLAEFAITNHSPRLVHFQGYQFVINSVPQTHQSETIHPGQSAVVSLTVPEPLEAHTHVELIFRRQDTPAEEAREMLDSLLRSIGVRIPGLNPDSTANIFKITATIPKQSKHP
jgi:hypothetical protein